MAEAEACLIEDSVLGRIDESRAEIFKRLKSFVTFRTIPKQARFAAETKLALDAVKQWLAVLGFTIDQDVVTDADAVNETIFASYFAGFEQVTVLIYADLNTPPAEKNDGWFSDPFSLSIRNNMVYGRGVTSGKGQLLCWLHALDAWQAETGTLPFNVKFIINAGFESLQELEAQLVGCEEFLAHIDYVLMFTNSWLDDQQPMVPCNINGLLKFGVQVKSIHVPQATAMHDYHFVHTALHDLCLLMDALANAERHTLLPQLERNCRAVSAAEWELLEAADCKMSPVEKLPKRQKADWLSRCWCRPTLSMHDVESPLSRQDKTLYTPASAMAKFTIKLVPDQNSQQVAGIVQDFITHKFKNLNSSNQLLIKTFEQFAPFGTDRHSTHIVAVCKALYRSHNVVAALPTSICHCVPTAQLLRAHCMSRFAFVPFAKFSASASAVNECMHVEFYLRNVKLTASLLWQIAQLHDECSATSSMHDAAGQNEEIP